MKIIEKIEIENFRSFLGSRENDKAEILEIVDLNIFSGSNDSGKSNILRTLNLFFNDEIDNVHKFNFDNDFNIFKKDLTQKVIKIKVSFVVDKRRFSISKFYDRRGYRNFEYRFKENEEEIVIDSRAERNRERYKNQPKILNKENGYRRYAIRFIPSISFLYVPAIREERFFSHLYGKIIYKIKQNEEKKIEQFQIEKRKIERWERTVKNKSEKKEFLENLTKQNWRESRIKWIDIEIDKISNLNKSIKELEGQINSFSSNLFRSVNFLSSEFKIGSNLIDFFESFEIGTGDKKEISLRLRGDGIQAKFIPEMLNFLDSISKDNRYFIWGFEEPENSSEYKNQQKLAEKLKNYSSEKKQIFMTTHSEEFLSLYDGVEIPKEKRLANLYHVKKIANGDYEDFSIIKLFDVEKQTFDFGTIKSEIEEDLGTSLIRAKYSKEFKEKVSVVLSEKSELEKEKSELEKEITDSKKPLIFVEGKSDKVYLQKAWGVLYPGATIPFDILQKGGKTIVSEIGNYTESSLSKKMIAIFDNDHSGFKYFELKTNKLCDNFGFYKRTRFIKKHTERDVFIYLLQPPSSRKNWVDASRDHRIFEMEHLFEDSFLTKTLKIKIPLTISATAKEWKAGDNFKQELEKKINLLKQKDLKVKDFKNFQPIFKKINELLQNEK